MNRLRMLFTLVIPSVLVGGLVFHDISGNAAADPDRDLWATPPEPPKAPKPPKPPKPPKAPKSGVSVTVNGDRIQITGIQELVTEHLESVREMLRHNPNIPKDVRDKIVARMDRVKSVVERRLKNLKMTDLDRLGDEMDEMGEELERALEGLDKDLASLDEKLSKQITKDIKQKLKFGPRPPDQDKDDDDHDSDAKDDHDDTDTDTDSADSSDPDDESAGTGVQIQLDDFKDFTLKPAQRDAIAKLHNESQARVAAVQKALDETSHRLETALADPRTSDAEVVRLVDQVSTHEAAIRKAKLLAWMQARRVLDPDQVKKLENAHKSH